ncbi:MAG: FAD-dependent oxidoreductase, partial [Candidatus Hydrogenedentes bacterium]|nr:FAD-dependent oxidoreductase [Candidatus Hydrogenedentota bacterium]
MTLLEQQELRCDILVAGGGVAGVSCALAAARNGTRVILVHDRPVLGGNASSEVRMHIVGANGTGHFDRGEELKTEAREGGIIEEIRLENCVRNPQRSPSMFDLILYEKCRTEANLTLLLNTTVTGVVMQDDTIMSAIAERQSTEDRFTIDARYFVDCTGDGRLGVEAGALFMEGREDREQHGESLAQDRADKKRLGSTILIQARRHDRPMPFVAPDWARRFSKEDLALRLYATPGEEEPTHEYGYWWAEYGGSLDTIKDNEEIRDELLAIVLGIWDHVKNGPEGTAPGADPFEASHWALDWFGFLPGKRESRRFVGHHVLTQDDLMNSREFGDAIAYGGWSIDLHPPEGIDAPELEPCVQHPVPWLYDIPLSACVSKNISNLCFSGRNISATHVAFASTRVMGTCAVMGQGVGTALAFASAEGLPLATLLKSIPAQARIQQQLMRDDCFLIGQVNADGHDLAIDATATASSELKNGLASWVNLGQTRAVHGERGVEAKRRPADSERWISDPAAGFPAWIELAWKKPIVPTEIQLIFDTGMHRHLTLSHPDGYTETKMKWGAAQPETVRDYVIEG